MSICENSCWLAFTLLEDILYNSSICQIKLSFELIPGIWHSWEILVNFDSNQGKLFWPCFERCVKWKLSKKGSHDRMCPQYCYLTSVQDYEYDIVSGISYLSSCKKSSTRNSIAFSSSALNMLNLSWKLSRGKYDIFYAEWTAFINRNNWF